MLGLWSMPSPVTNSLKLSDANRIAVGGVKTCFPDIGMLPFIIFGVEEIVAKDDYRCCSGLSIVAAVEIPIFDNLTVTG